MVAPGLVVCALAVAAQYMSNWVPDLLYPARLACALAAAVPEESSLVASLLGDAVAPAVGACVV